MILDNINLNLLRVFEAVCRTGSMTKAANEVHLTQSGVSQNIKNLEELLGLTLFDRVKGRPIPTPKGHELFVTVKRQLGELEHTLAHILEEDVKLKGEIYLGIPIEYGNSFIMPLVSEFSREHPQVEFRFFYGHASQMNHMLLKGELDFGIVDSFSMDDQIETLEVGYEVHTLCAQKNYLKKFGTPGFNKDFLSRLDYIAYLDNAPVLTGWFQHHLKRLCFEGRIKATLMDVQGVGQLIAHGFGAGVLPRHVALKFLKEGYDIHIFEEEGRPLINRLSLATLKGRTQGLHVSSFIDLLKNNLKSFESTL